MPEVTCTLCRQGRLKGERIYYFYGSAVTVGYVLLVIGGAGAVIMLIRYALALVTDLPADPTAAGWFLLLAAAGYVLTLRRLVLHCTHCHAIFPAAH